MKRLSIMTASALALTLAACGEDVEESVVEDTSVAEVDEYDPMTRDYTLSEEATTRRSEFDEDAFNTEYDGYREDVRSEQVRMGNDADAKAEMTDDDREEMAAASEAREPSTNMRARENMTWSYLDRNDDNKLSVAEYAIWAVPLDPNAKAENDQGEPQLKADTANKAADSFFYYDIDGDTYLDRREFTSARRGENFDDTSDS